MSDSTSAMPNGFDILKKMWEAFSPPATFTSPLTQLMQSAAPLLDPNEIENRIAEMRAVEQWLTLNLNVLRSTIQAFEVQRATYATLRAFGTGNFGAAGTAGETHTGAADAGDAGTAHFWRSPFATSEPAQDVEPEPQASADEPEMPPDTASETDAEPQGAAEGAGASAAPFAQASSAYGALDPSMWFNAMRAQFDQIAAAAQAAGVSAAQMTEAAAAHMSEAAAKATHAATGAASSTPGKASGKTAGKTAGNAGTGARKTSAKTATKTAAKRAPASKKTPAKSAAVKTSAKTSAKASTKTSGNANDKTNDKTARAPAATGKQAAWKW
ncbi:PhaM family polyhydroxyalkanoate granule multifunctional regulatory protein [Pandoraea anhela]|uniref:Uncharacterized protein n=1 Tax=Pandoraea anhela TaxID=2508295 RepID=A0A5E4SBS0_9BURK|nr:PhaM family polyhydroxyalkanoate granule multifunctional regulatory protein [Pandoraea anhela]VVD72523.1 hypothetical protein PAN31108_00673 [Pandoraea anhela]